MGNGVCAYTITFRTGQRSAEGVSFQKTHRGVGELGIGITVNLPKA